MLRWAQESEQMTNGGGVGEADRCRRLTKTLGVEVKHFANILTCYILKNIIQIKPSMLIQAHTILREKAAAYADQHVLVLGGKRNQLREVAERCVAQDLRVEWL